MSSVPVPMQQLVMLLQEKAVTGHVVPTEGATQETQTTSQAPRNRTEMAAQ
jgi:hypothetical protein